MRRFFEWDPAKAASNLRKHGISFETAFRIFADPLMRTEPERANREEQRWETIGRLEEGLLLVVIHTTTELLHGELIEIVRIISARKPLTRRKGDAMSNKMVRIEVDLANLPPLTEKQKAEIAALLARPDDEIDYSDIPPLTEEFWKNAVRNPFYRPTKTSTTVRIDSDVLAWLRAQGKGYQSRINAILRREMLQSLKP